MLGTAGQDACVWFNTFFVPAGIIIACDHKLMQTVQSLATRRTIGGSLTKGQGSRPTTDDRRPTTDDRRPTTDDRRPTTKGLRTAPTHPRTHARSRPRTHARPRPEGRCSMLARAGKLKLCRPRCRPPPALTPADTLRRAVQRYSAPAHLRRGGAVRRRVGAHSRGCRWRSPWRRWRGRCPLCVHQGPMP